MGMTLWPARETLRRESVLRQAELILNQRLWLPIYEDGGLEALMKAGEIPYPAPPRPDPSLCSMSTGIR
jgi:hypothetical protein